jgi:four helix bundle protein
MTPSSDKPAPITDRTFAFSIRIVELCRALGKHPINRVLGTQLLRAGTSIGANVEESQAAHSRREFACKSAIALKEARETHYWLRLIAATDAVLGPRLGPMVQESREIRDILGAITSKARKPKDDE